MSKSTASSKIDELAKELQALKAEFELMKNLLKPVPESKKFYYSSFDKERTRYLNRDEILTLLIQLGMTEGELSPITNYKQALVDKLTEMEYHGCLNFIVLNEWFAKNKPLAPLTDEQILVKERILKVIEERKKSWDESHNR